MGDKELSAEAPEERVEDVGESIDETLARIVGDDESEPSAETQDAPESKSEESDDETEVDQEALSQAQAAFLRDGLTVNEIALKLKRDGDEKFISRGLKRAKKHEADDAAYAELRQLKNRREEPDPEDKGEARNAGAPTLNLQELAAPLVDRLGLDDDGAKDLVAALEAVNKHGSNEVERLAKRSDLIESVLLDQLLDGVREEVGLGQIDDSDWSQVRETYDEIAQTPRHKELTGKARMKALMVDAARLSDVEPLDQKEIQRKASIAKAKRKGTSTVPSRRPKAKTGMTRDEKFEKAAQMAISGGFKSVEEAQEWGLKNS